MKMTRTWDSTMSMIPRGGDTIWGNLDWAPEKGYSPSRRKQSDDNTNDSIHTEDNSDESKPTRVHYGRIISFGKDAAAADSSEIERIEFRVTFLNLSE